jgi:hypothetical protein
MVTGIMVAMLVACSVLCGAIGNRRRPQGAHEGGRGGRRPVLQDNSVY